MEVENQNPQLMRTGFSEPEIEQAYVSCLMQDPRTTFPVGEGAGITPEHFRDERCRTLLQFLTPRQVENKPFDLIAVIRDLDANALLVRAGGKEFVTQAWIETCHAPKETIAYYVDLLVDAHARRNINSTLNDLRDDIQSPAQTADELVSATLTKLETIPTSVKQEPDHKTEMIDSLMARIETGVNEAVIKTGLTELDKGSPLWQSDMPLIVGERKAGKTILALSISLNVARSGTPVLYFSLEDDKIKIGERLLSGLSRVSAWQQSAQNPQTIDALSKFRSLPITVRDDLYDLPRIVTAIRQAREKGAVGLVIIDYAQLVRVTDSHEKNREQKVAEVSRGLRLLALETKIPIMLLSQLNAEGFTRESRALEQDATACWRIEQGNSEEERHGVRYIRVPWQRNGQSDIAFKVTFLGAIARVENYQHETLK